jgi:hypothetical protein
MVYARVMRHILALFFLSIAAFAAEPNTLTADEQAAGWKLLFDGKSTAGWKGIGKKEFPAKGWVAEGGTLKHIAKGGGGDIVTTDEFENFEFAWEWKIAEGANSGVKYNLPDANKGVGCEYQLIDDTKHADAKNQTHQTAGLYDLISPAAERKVSPVGEWNASRIVVNGNKVEHWLNGTKTVEFEFGSEALKTLIAKSKYKNAAGFGVKKKGPILLQDHGDAVEFRNLKLRALP